MERDYLSQILSIPELEHMDLGQLKFTISLQLLEHVIPFLFCNSDSF